MDGTAKVDGQPRASEVFKVLDIYDDFYYSPRPTNFGKKNALNKTRRA